MERMDTGRLCLRCGQAIPWGETQCPTCSQERGYRWPLRRETFLLLIFLFMILLFVGTSFAVRSFQNLEKNLAEEWYAKGEKDLMAGHADSALTDFRNALAYSPDRPLYRLRLAQALAAAGRTHEARTYLVNLWESEPGNATVNLGLARVAAQERNVPEAIRYYHAAIYGEWDDDPVKRRVETRMELVRFLLASDQKSEARAELIALGVRSAPRPRAGNQCRQFTDASRWLRRRLKAVSPGAEDGPPSGSSAGGGGPVLL